MGHMVNLFIFIGFLLAVVVAFIVMKVKWARADRALEVQQVQNLEQELADEAMRRQAKKASQ